MLEPIKFKNAIKINQCIKTNSVPFEIICEDAEIHYAKTTFKPNPPFDELINEILCNYLLKCWGIRTAVPCIIKIPQNVYDTFVEEGNYVDPRYKNFDFKNKLFFGVEHVKATEVEIYSLILKNKIDYNKYGNPTDLIKIGIFDHWIGNNDRRPENPNILLIDGDGVFNFLAIDHTQAFGYQNNYKALNPAIMNMPRGNSILNTPISKSIITFAGSNFINKFDKEIIECIKKGLENLDFIFEQIPASYGLSKKGKIKVKEVLSIESRNKTISKSYLNYSK